MTMARKLFLWMGPLFLLVSGCGGSTNNNPTNRPDPTLVFINASSDTPAVDFFTNDTKRGDNVAYLTSTGNFVSVPFISQEDGGYDLTAFVAGTGEELDRQFQFLDRDVDAMVIAYGLRNFGNEPFKRFSQAAINVDRKRPTGDKSRLMIFHGLNRSVGNLTPSITFQTPGDNPLIKIENIGYGSQTQTTVDAGTYEWQVRRADTDGENIYATSSATVDSGKIYLVLVTGVEGASGNQSPRITFIELPSSN